ncbi:MAG: sulfatase-like hydrolase/transferase, partial [Rhodospirillales bacterium]|nr:sulfatase-like hydrolase/transferase [Rhodospirillales bacterium]
MTKPNVLLIVTDHWSASLLGAAGHPAIQTPTLNQLCRNGVRFTNAYSECPVCIPARRTLMTGASCRAHGDRTFQPRLEMPDLPTLAQTFRDNGYQAYAVGKTHTYPQRDRIGFDDILFDDEGRTLYGVTDDYEIFLGDAGYPGRQFDHGMSNNAYGYAAWHLPEHVHATNWATREMARYVRRRDPKRPSFWYIGYRHPHPPLVPPQRFLDYYRDMELDEPFVGDWARDTSRLPYHLQGVQARGIPYNEHQAREARRAFYALCTHIDHQIGSLIGSIREEGLLDNTIIMFTSDHGDMLGNHGMWAKQTFFEWSAGIPMVLMGTENDRRVGFNRIDDRLVGLRDVMPTLCGLAGIEVPETVEGLSMLGDARREHLYGEFGEVGHCSRMIRSGDHKLIYYPVGNVFQLFDITNDPKEMNDLSASPDHAEILDKLTRLLIAEL